MQSLKYSVNLYFRMLKNGQTHFKKRVNTARFLKYVWPFSTLLNEGLRTSYELNGSSMSLLLRVYFLFW